MIAELEGRVAVVTGAASGIGFALSEKFAQEGMKVVLADVEKPALEAAASSLRDRGANVLAIETDVSRFDDVKRLADTVYAEFGEVHLVCNNAGVQVAGRLWECTLDDWKWVLGVNLWGVIHGVKAFVPKMVERNVPGHILNTSSVAGLISGPSLGIYATSKFGVVALSEALYFDLKAAGSPIGVSVLCPGFVRTRIAEAARNRPSELSETVSGSALVDEEVARRILETGMDPAEVAEIAVRGVKEGRLYIYTHPWTLALIDMRRRSLEAGVPEQGLLQAMATSATENG